MAKSVTVEYDPLARKKLCIVIINMSDLPFTGKSRKRQENFDKHNQ